MTAQIIHEVAGFEDLKELATAKGPCITAVVPLPNPVETKTRIKNAIRGIQRQLAERGTDPRTASDLIAPIEELAEDVTTSGTWAYALIVPLYGFIPVLPAARTIPGSSDRPGAVPGAAAIADTGSRDAFLRAGAEPAARAPVTLHTKPGRTGGARCKDAAKPGGMDEQPSAGSCPG